MAFPGHACAPTQVDKYWAIKYKRGSSMKVGRFFREKVKLANQKKLGVVPAYASCLPGNPVYRPWNSLSADQKKSCLPALWKSNGGYL